MAVHSHTVCVALLLLLLGVRAATGTDAVYTEEVCFNKDPPATEVYINCSSAEVINVMNATYGVQEGTCPSLADPCLVVPTPSVLETLYGKCMGSRECRVMVSPAYLPTCSHTSTFFSVTFSCIPVEVNGERQLFNICGEGYAGTNPNTTSSTGYIESLTYPANYSPDTSCSCHLGASDPKAHVHLEVLDMHLYPGLNPSWYGDWLEYVTDQAHWGEGIRLNTAQKNKRYILNTNQVFLNFKSDALKESRGFWIKYQGVLPDGQPSPINLFCRDYKPKEYKMDSTCFPIKQNGEVYLSCQSQGVINVIATRQGYTSISPCPLTTLTNDTCAVTSGPDLITSLQDKCQGQPTCLASVQSITLPDCAKLSNYVQTEYQCVSSIEPTNLVDICGEKLSPGQSVRRTIGYIESLNYPDRYPSNSNCTCQLESVERDTDILLSVVDIELAGDSNNINDCQNDALFVTSPSLAQTTKLCNMTKNEPLILSSDVVFLNFVSDDLLEMRGFWVKYKGRSKDGLNVPLQLKCWANTDNQGPAYSPDNKETDNEESGGTDIGLAVGLTVTAVLLLTLLVLAAVAYRHKRHPSGISESPQSGRRTTPLSKFHSSNRYSSFSGEGVGGGWGQGAGAPHQSPHSHPHTEPRPDYDVDFEPTPTRTNAYMNRAFENDINEKL